MAGLALADAEPRPSARHQVEHGHRLGRARRMVVVGDDLTDAESDADLLGLGRQRCQEDLGRRAVRVLLEEVVFDRPRMVEPDLVGQHHLLRRLLDAAEFALGVPRLGDL